MNEVSACYLEVTMFMSGFAPYYNDDELNTELDGFEDEFVDSEGFDDSEEFNEPSYQQVLDRVRQHYGDNDELVREAMELYPGDFI
jgi:hypothetical protein